MAWSHEQRSSGNRCSAYHSEGYHVANRRPSVRPLFFSLFQFFVFMI
jgi:hypothetical protein